VKHPDDLPLNKDMTARFAPKVIALMVYLGTLCFVFTLFMVHSSTSWEQEFTTHLSIEIPSVDNASSTLLQEDVLDLLKETPGIQKAAPVPQKEMASLFRSLLGNDIDIDFFSLPSVIDVSLAPEGTVDITKLEQALKKISPHTHLTDQRTWQAQVANLIHTSILITFSITVLILLAAFATATFATKTSLLIHRHIIEVLSLIGAPHDYIAGQFQRHALKQALLASGLGSCGAFLTFFVLMTLLERADFPCTLESSFFSQTLCIFALVPFLTAFAIMFSVRRAVLKDLRS
jgi:cell division transport system permease protein